MLKQKGNAHISPKKKVKESFYSDTCPGHEIAIKAITSPRPCANALTTRLRRRQFRDPYLEREKEKKKFSRKQTWLKFPGKDEQDPSVSHFGVRAYFCWRKRRFYYIGIQCIFLSRFSFVGGPLCSLVLDGE